MHMSWLVKKIVKKVPCVYTKKHFLIFIKKKKISIFVPLLYFSLFSMHLMHVLFKIAHPTLVSCHVQYVAYIPVRPIGRIFKHNLG